MIENLHQTNEKKIFILWNFESLLSLSRNFFSVCGKVATVFSSFGFGYGLVLLCFDRTRKPFFSNFFFKFLKNMKIQYKNTLNQTKIRISQNLIFKNNNNIIFRQFENILYFEVFKCLVLGLVRFGFRLYWKIAVWFESKFFVLGLVRLGLGLRIWLGLGCTLRIWLGLVLKIEN
jgi:hypothetical protein